MPVSNLPIRPDDVAEHADHDELLLVAFADGSLPDAERSAAAALAASCPACARLVDDVRILRTAVRALPAPARGRDFRLSEADAARLRRSGWQRLLWPLVAPLAAPRFAFTRPLAAALVTAGLAGILVATVPGTLQAPQRTLSTIGNSVAIPEGASGDAAAGAAPGASEGLTAAGVPAPSAAPSVESVPRAAVAPALPAGTLPPGVTMPSVPAPSGSAAAGQLAPAEIPGSAETGSRGAASVPMGVEPRSAGPPPLLALALVVLAAGLGLFVLRLAARRLA